MYCEDLINKTCDIVTRRLHIVCVLYSRSLNTSLSGMFVKSSPSITTSKKNLKSHLFKTSILTQSSVLIGLPPHQAPWE